MLTDRHRSENLRYLSVSWSDTEPDRFPVYAFRDGEYTEIGWLSINQVNTLAALLPRLRDEWRRWYNTGGGDNVD